MSTSSGPNSVFEATDVPARDDQSQRSSSQQVRPPAELRFDGVWKSFANRNGDDFLAVKDINLEIPSGTFNCIIGPSGCGKSTLLNMAAGLMKPSQGTVFHREQVVRRVNSRVGYMTQQSLLLPWRTLERNVGISLEIRGVSRAERKRRVANILERVGLKGFEHRYPSQLSGGMQKRAAIARTLIYEPDTILMDEPFAALDAQLKLTMQRELLALWERDKKTVLFVTHDLEEALLLGDRVIVFGKAPGRIVHSEEVTFERPRDLVHLRGSAEFSAMWERLWLLLEPSKGTK